MKAILALPCLILSGAVVSAQNDVVKKELDKLQGTWQLVSLKAGGIVFPEDFVRKLKVVIKKDQFVIEGDDKLAQKFGKMTLVIDAAATPKIMDFKIVEGPDKGSVREGIYEVKGDDFRLCANLVTPDRPGEFETTEGSNRLLAAFKREK